MKTLLTKERYEASFRKLMRKTLLISAIFHILVFLPMYVKSKTERERLFYAPVYTVNIVSPGRVAKMTVKKSKPKPKLKKRPKPKSKPKPKPKPKLNGGPTFAKEAHIEKEKPPEKTETEKTLQDTLARLREDVEKREKMEDTLKKLSKQVEKREKKDDIVVAEKIEPKEEVKGFGRLTQNMMNITEKKYYNLIWKNIRDEWVLPTDISKKDEDIVTIIVIRIEKDGHVSKIDIEESSGISYYDQSAIRAIKKAEPFPKLSDEMNRDFFKVGIRFRPSKD